MFYGLCFKSFDPINLNSSYAMFPITFLLHFFGDPLTSLSFVAIGFSLSVAGLGSGGVGSTGTWPTGDEVVASGTQVGFFRWMLISGTFW